MSSRSFCRHGSGAGGLCLCAGGQCAVSTEFCQLARPSVACIAVGGRKPARSHWTIGRRVSRCRGCRACDSEHAVHTLSLGRVLEVSPESPTGSLLTERLPGWGCSGGLQAETQPCHTGAAATVAWMRVLVAARCLREHVSFRPRRRAAGQSKRAGHRLAGSATPTTARPAAPARDGWTAAGALGAASALGSQRRTFAS